MAVSESRKRANAKYNAKKIADGTNKRLGLTIKATDFDLLEQYASAQGLSKAALVVRAVRWCAENGIDLADK